ncbi:MAG: hypothetical protein WBB01_16480 [Phormidesmis sp.]
MRYLSVFLFALLAIAGCSGNDTVTTFNSPADEVAEAESSTSEDEIKAEASLSAANTDIEGANQKNVKLVVNNQPTAGQIIVKTVATARDGWVSIHKSEEDGSIQLPESIGEARVDAGDTEGVVVDLWEAPYVGEKLWVLLHVDAGERGIYEFPEKDVIVSKNGEMMARSFQIKAEEKDEEATE